jgi:hypothetical protein
MQLIQDWKKPELLKIYLFPHMRALEMITGRHACGNAAGGKGNNDHQDQA